jgi:hypothetical protein
MTFIYMSSDDPYITLFFAAGGPTPFYMTVSIIIFCFLVILPPALRASLNAKYSLYIGGVCDVPTNYIMGIILPWILAEILTHV